MAILEDKREFFLKSGGDYNGGFGEYWPILEGRTYFKKMGRDM